MTLEQLRSNSPLVATVNAKYNAALGTGKKPERAAELKGRLALLQFTCQKMARYKWSVVRSFHAAATQSALRIPGQWIVDFQEMQEIKEYYFDGDGDNMITTPTAGISSTVEKTKGKSPRPCFKYARDEFTSSTCRFDHCCSYCLDKTGMKFRHPDTACRRKRDQDKKRNDDEKTTTTD
ncbi:Hypp6456 [Branchiostoma lanceolatum]|uniref:Hypp6456 protein n=1 Tax=Branchiostoma lanceolatum TaxID=7740 RepID=A0A8K0E4S0_BRALA|nr:Hypp6456 [Branchiostoma lanceolatum]